MQRFQAHRGHLVVHLDVGQLLRVHQVHHVVHLLRGYSAHHVGHLDVVGPLGRLVGPWGRLVLTFRVFSLNFLPVP